MADGFVKAFPSGLERIREGPPDWSFLHALVIERPILLTLPFWGSGDTSEELAALAVSATTFMPAG